MGIPPATQVLQDSLQHKGNFRRPRNIIPTTAEAAKAVGRVIPALEGKLIGSAIRVPVPADCLIIFVAVISGTNLTVERINDIMKASSTEIFGYTEE